MIGADIMMASIDQSTGQGQVADRYALEHALPELKSELGGVDILNLIDANTINNDMTIQFSRQLVDVPQDGYHKPITTGDVSPD